MDLMEGKAGSGLQTLLTVAVFCVVRDIFAAPQRKAASLMATAVAGVLEARHLIALGPTERPFVTTVMDSPAAGEAKVPIGQVAAVARLECQTLEEEVEVLAVREEPIQITLAEDMLGVMEALAAEVQGRLMSTVAVAVAVWLLVFMVEVLPVPVAAPVVAPD
jgi:hypothetical protein